MAPLFPAAIFAIFYYLRKKRMALWIHEREVEEKGGAGEEGMATEHFELIQHSYFTTFMDRIPTSYK
jgi:hypothetical protein